MLLRRNFVSGRNPKRFEVNNGYYEVVSGPQRFNRALYGSRRSEPLTRFKALAGDLPEVLMYMPGDGGRALFGILVGSASKWLSEMAVVRAQYDAGEMRYELADPILEGGSLSLCVIPLADAPGAIIKVSASGMPQGARFMIVYGGATSRTTGRGFDPGYTREQDVAFKPSMCSGNEVLVGVRSFTLVPPNTRYGVIRGRVTYGSDFGIGDAECVGGSPADLIGGLGSPAGETPALRVAYHIAELPVGDFEGYVMLECCKDQNGGDSSGSAARSSASPLDIEAARRAYQEARRHYTKIAQRVVAKTPSIEIDAGVRAACVATEAIWYPPVFVHGAWSWDNPLLGWRSLYGPITFGWHDRVVQEVDFFASMQLLESDGTGRTPDPDPRYHLARQSPNSVFVSSGMIPFAPGKRAVAQYDMQSVFMDEVIYEYYWTGDLEFARRIFPVLKRHIEWQKRCFDPDGDGLYENFANFWASDGIFSSGAGCSLGSAYNYRANIAAASIATRLGEDPQPFVEAARRIKDAVDRWLWLDDRGHLAERRDAYGERLIHPSVDLPSIVHSVESGILDDFQVYQTMRYTEYALERVPVEGSEGQLVWTSNWVPYVWSVREIDYADVYHASLGYYRIGMVEEAYKLLSGALVDSTCNNLSPGAFMCLYNGKSVDFADTVSMFGRAVIEGLFGIRPRMHEDTMVISPGFPRDWKSASLKTPDVEYEYSFDGKTERLAVRTQRVCRKEIRLIAKGNKIAHVMVDAEEVAVNTEPGIGHAYIVVSTEPNSDLVLTVEYRSGSTASFKSPSVAGLGETIRVSSNASRITKVYDPQGVLSTYDLSESPDFVGTVRRSLRLGYHSVFLLVEDGDLTYWRPIDLEIRERIEAVNVSASVVNLMLRFAVRNNTGRSLDLTLRYGEAASPIRVAPYSESEPIALSLAGTDPLLPGRNTFNLNVTGDLQQELPVRVVDWDLGYDDVARGRLRSRAKMVQIAEYYNDRVSDIFAHEYLSPRSPYCSLQVPLHLFPSDWCTTEPKGIELMDDSVLRSSVDQNGVFVTDVGVPFLQESKSDALNVAFVSKWSNFPSELTIDLKARGRKLYLLVAGYTNQMQCGVVNGLVEVLYADGCKSALELIAPSNFRSLEKGPSTERDEDRTCYGSEPVYRVRFSDKQTIVQEVAGTEQVYTIGGLHGQLLDMELRPVDVVGVKVTAVANDAVIGLMGLTFVE